MTERRGTDDGPVGVVAILCLLCELGMLALLAWAGWRLGGGLPTQIIAAVGAPVVAIAIWSVWLAPRGSSRLDDPGRLIVQTVLFVAVAAVLASSGEWIWGVAFAVVATVVFALSRRVA